MLLLSKTYLNLSIVWKVLLMQWDAELPRDSSSTLNWRLFIAFFKSWKKASELIANWHREMTFSIYVHPVLVCF